MASTSFTAYLGTLPEFANPARVQALYRDLAPQRSSNPSAYTATVAWWLRALPDALAHGAQRDAITLRADATLRDALRWPKAGAPLGLGCVFEEGAHRTPPVLVPRAAFDRAAYTAPGYVASVLAWLLARMSLGAAEERGEDVWRRVQSQGSFVVLPNLERAADGVLARHAATAAPGLAGALFTREGFRDAFKSHAIDGVELSEDDIDVLLRFLARERGAIVRDGDVIKFLDASHAEKEKVAVTDVDRGVLSMSTTVEKLDTQLASLSSQIDAKNAAISVALRANKKDDALRWLRARKALEDLRRKRAAARDTLQEQLDAVERAAGDAEIVQAYETAAKTLRTVMAQPTLQRDHVERTMDEMAEALADQREIDSIIRAGEASVEADIGIDDSELAEELRGLVLDVEREKEEERLKAAEADRMKREAEAERLKMRDEAEARRRAELDLAKAAVPTDPEAEWQRRFDDAAALKEAEKVRASQEAANREERKQQELAGNA